MRRSVTYSKVPSDLQRGTQGITERYLFTHSETDDGALVALKDLERLACAEAPAADGVVGRAAQEHLASRVSGETRHRPLVTLQFVELV